MAGDAPEERHGLFRLHPPRGQHKPHKCDVDIVAIHGLNGRALHTWTDDGGHLWLRDSLPVHVPGARIMTFGYNSAVLFNASRSGISDFAVDLGARLDYIRRRPEEKRRPLIFICHSLGGIVFKSLLVLESIKSSLLAQSICGVVFLGCPHRGSRTAGPARIFSSMINAASFGRGVRKDLIKALEVSSTQLSDISRLAVTYMAKIPIVSFYETRPLGPAMIVEPFSAMLGLPNERAIPIDADHREIARVSQRRPHRYLLVWSAVKDLAEASYLNLKLDNRTLLKDLFCLDFRAAQVRPRQPQQGTGEWIFSNTKYLQWLQSPRASMLLLTSKAGSGKSVLTRRVVERLLSGSDASDAEGDYIGASYFCSYTDAAINSEEVVLKSILHQLVQANPRCGSVVRECVTDANRPDQKKYDKGALRNALNAVLAMPSMHRTFIAVDAVDELGVALAADVMRSLSLAVDQLCETQPASRVRIFVSARPNHFRLRQSEALQQLSMTDDIVNRDIQVYLEGKIDDLADRNDGFAALLSPKIRRRIVDSIIRTAGGMFLAAELAWDDFGRGLLWNDDIIAQKLQHIERAAPGLVSFYEKTIARIDKAEIEDALAIFSVLAAAARPLSEQELGTILSMARVTGRRIRHSNDFQPYQGLGFIIENKLPDLLRFQDDDRITFVHLSFKDFFESKAEYGDDIEWGRQAIVRSCLEYIQLDDLLEYGKRTKLKPRELEDRFRFFPYAKDHSIWHINARPVEDPLWLLFADSAGEGGPFTLPSFSSTWSITNIGGNGPSPLQHIVRNVTAPKKLQLIRKFDEHGYDLDEKWSDDTCGRPLQYCCSWAGNFPDLKEAALLLLALGANPSLPSRPHRTNIQAALDKEVWDLYDALFRHPMTDFRDRDAVGRPVLHSVVRAAPVDRVIELIEVLAEADMSLQDHNGYTPLHVAISSGRLEVVRELLRAPGVHLDMTDNDGRTPLTLATYWGLKQIALVLIEPSHLVKMDEADHMRALILAAKHYDKELCIRLLELCRYRNLNSYADETGKMILHHAAREDWADVLDACIRNGGHGLRIDCIDHSGRTALHHAAFMGNIDSCRVLLQGGASLTQQDRNGKTAAQAAADAGFKETLLLLLRSGRVDPNQRDLEGRNLVHWAATLDCVDVMELIAGTKGVRLDQPDKYGKLPIDIAFICKSRSVGKYLGARMPFLDIYSWDGMYCSPDVGCVEPESIDWEKKFDEDRQEGERARRRRNREAWEALRRVYPHEEWALVHYPEASTKPDIETAPRAGAAGRRPPGESPSRRGEDGGGFKIIPAESFTL